MNDWLSTGLLWGLKAFVAAVIFVVLWTMLLGVVGAIAEWVDEKRYEDTKREKHDKL